MPQNLPLRSARFESRGGVVALRGALEQRRSRLLAPRQGGGVRLRGVVLLSRSPLHPVCRFAQDDTWGTGARDGKQNAVSDSFTELYFQPSKLRTTFRLTHRVILSEAAPPAKNHARPPIIAAQSNPAPSGAPAGGISLVEKHHITLRTAEKSLPPGGEGGAPATDEGETGERTT